MKEGNERGNEGKSVEGLCSYASSSISFPFNTTSNVSLQLHSFGAVVSGHGGSCTLCGTNKLHHL